MFFNGNREDIWIEITLDDLPKTPAVVAKAVVRVLRNESSCNATSLTPTARRVSSRMAVSAGRTTLRQPPV